MANKKNHKDAKNSHSSKRRPRYEINESIMEGTVDGVVDGTESEMGAEAINTEAQNEGVTATATHEPSEMKSGDSFTHGSPAHVNLDKPQAEAEFVSEGGPSFGDETSARSAGARSKVHLDFYGSELIRQKAPKVMEIADTVADEWTQDGQFEGLPLGNPLAQMAASKALRKAKDVEKKLEEKGVFMMAKIGVDYLKSKINKR